MHPHQQNRTLMWVANARHMKRRRPWSIRRKRNFGQNTTLATVFLLVASGLVESLPFFEGVGAQSVDQESPPLVELDASLPPTAAPPPSGAVVPPPLVTILKKAVPIEFDIVVQVPESADLEKVADDLDGVLELYLLENISEKVEDEDIDVRAVELDVIRKQRFLAPEERFLRRSLQEDAQDVSFLVEGILIYDIDFSGCIECVDQLIEEEVSKLLEIGIVDSAIQSQIDSINEVTSVLVLDEDGGGSTQNQDEVGGTGNGDRNGVNGVQDADEGQPERPSTLSIVIGFVLTGLAALSLLFYLFLFYRKRQRKLRKKKQQRQNTPYNMASAPNAANMLSKEPRRVSPAAPTSASTPAIDDDSDGSSFKGVDSNSSGGEPVDSFGRELQMAASLDQQAWDDLQRQKTAVDSSSKDQRAMESRSTPVKRERATSPTSFPYGDEAETGLSEGVEWTMEDAGRTRSTAGWEPYSSDLLGREEKKEDWGSPGSRDPEPSRYISDETNAMMQSIERTLSQYGESSSFGVDEPNLAPDEVVDEVNRLSSFVKRYERRKERRHQREIDILNRSTPTTGSFLSAPSVDSTAASREYRSFEEPIISNPGSLLSKKPDFESNEDDTKPRNSNFMGITMTGAMYGNNDDKRMFALSDSEDDDYSNRDDDGSLPSQRLGITPFKVQASEDLQSDSSSSPPLEGHQRSAFEPRAGANSMETRMTGAISQQQRQPNVQNEQDRFRPGNQSTRLSDLRKSEAVIDGTQSDVNVGFFPVVTGAVPVPTTSPQPTFMSTKEDNGPQRALFGTGNEQVQHAEPVVETPEKANPVKKASPSPPKVKANASPNPKFNKLRNIFEDKPKNAIFPPDEHWQSGVSKT